MILHDPAGDGGVAHAGAALADGAGCRPKAAERITKVLAPTYD